MVDLIKWLQDWYLQNCNGDWEHCYGIKIDTLDNPGWLVDIDLVDTIYENKYFEKIVLERNEDDWIHCSLVNGIFKGCGGVRNLEEILRAFKKWIIMIS